MWSKALASSHLSYTYLADHYNLLRVLLCNDIISIKKLLAEVTPAEHQTILGWVIDSQSLLIQLPENKLLAWTCAIDETLATKCIQHSNIDWSSQPCQLHHPNVTSFSWPSPAHTICCRPLPCDIMT
jgi:hypothetical protein